jgi:hypothetical protein
MRHTTPIALFGAALLLAVGCSAPGEQPLDERSRPAVSLEEDEVPPDLCRCQLRFGDRDQWPQPDALYGIAAQPEAVVLVVDGEPLCRTELRRLLQQPEDAFREGSLQPVYRNTGAGDDEAKSPTGDSNPLPARVPPTSGDAAASFEEPDPGDSNPLPADNGPTDEGTASSQQETGDSNPLPARDGDRDTSSPYVEDSNPLPAHSRPADSHQGLDDLSDL